MESNNCVHIKGINIPEFTTTSTADSGSIVSELTFGEKLVGLTFNPSGDDKVLKAKKLCAELADLVEDGASLNSNNSYLYNLIKGNALREILNAQMNVVKLLTFNK